MRKQNLYRKVNTKARNVRHLFGGEYSWQRQADKSDDSPRGTMHGKKRRGLDYTPLFMFLLSRVGDDFDEVYKEAAARLDKPDPIFWMVARTEADKRSYVRTGYRSYYSGLYVDLDNRLAKVDPDWGVEHMTPRCSCCTHSFNGVSFTTKLAE